MRSTHTVRGLIMTDINIHFDIEPLAQPTDDSCWATSLAMVISHKYSASYTPENVAQAAGWSIYQCDNADWQPIWDVASTFHLNSTASACMNVDGWAQLLQHGPLWLCVNNGGHAVVLVGMQGDGTAEHTKFLVNDPLVGATTSTYDTLESMFEAIDGVDGQNLVVFH
jgi:ABC-type bacteriocin/lantibiotic exporter with double-glycine peptidase domain